MALAINLRKVLDRKEWEQMTPSPVATVAGGFAITDPSGEDKAVVYIGGASAIYRYDHFQDAWQQLPNSGIAGTFGAGSCGTFHHSGPSGTATAGTSTTFTTSLTINRSIAGYKVRITGGACAGDERTIISNTYGTNSVITVTPAFSGTADTTTTYVLLTGRYWFFNAGSGAVGFSYYDRALNTWTARSVTNLPTTFGTDGRLCQTYSKCGEPFASGTATGGSATTIVNSAKTWTASQWIGYQVRITSGTGAGQTRIISANTPTTITVSSSWTTTPDSSSVYVVEGNEDALYLLGNNAVTMYKYSISGNSWSAVSPAVARAGAFAVGGGANWVSGVKDSAWNNESSLLNGRRIYSFRGGASAVLDYYDIPSNSWSSITYVPQVDTFNTGSSYDYDDDYIMISKENTGRLFRYIIPENRLIPFSTLVYPNGTAVVGDKMWTKTYTEGSVSVKWVYYLMHTGALLFRCMMIDS